jgi:hypothetical protein
VTACTETGESARENLAAITSTLEDLAGDFDALVRHADRHGLAVVATRLRHMEREMRLVLQQGDALIGAVMSAEKGED